MPWRAQARTRMCGRQAPVGGYSMQRWPEKAGGAAPARPGGAPAADDGGAAPPAPPADWRGALGGLQAGVDAQLRRALADALLLLEPVRALGPVMQCGLWGGRAACSAASTYITPASLRSRLQANAAGGRRASVHARPA